MTKPAEATHTVKGVVGTRKSYRVYTHATVVTYDPVWYAKVWEPRDLESRKLRAERHWDYLAEALRDDAKLRAEAERKDAAFTAEIRAKRADNPQWAGQEEFTSDIYINSVNERFNSAQQALIRYGSREGYVAAELVEAKQKLAEEYAKGVYRYVLSWHMSPRAASAFANTQAKSGMYAEVTVEEVQRSR